MPGIKNNVKVGNIVLIIFMIYIFGSPIFSSLGNMTSSNSAKSSTADGFTISSYNVILDVEKNNVVNVTENIEVNWYEKGHHGIYKFIPTWLEYTGKDDKKIKRKSNIENLTVVGEEYVVDNVGKDKKRVKIGSKAITMPIGEHTYTIKYKYDMGRDPFKNFDEFIFHAYGDFWGTKINNASIQINMPSEFDAKKVTFWADKYRGEDITSSVKHYVKGNTIYANVSNTYDLKKSLTVDIELPQGYFIGGSDNYGMVCFMISIIVVIGAIIMFLTWRRLGKDHEKIAETIEFYPPDELDSAQIGYIYGKQTSKKLTIALIVQLASKGYIKIDDTEDKSSQIITNLYPEISSKVKGLNNEPLRTIKISKLKEEDNTLTQDEKIWLKYLFKNDKNTADIITAFDNFYERSKSLIENGFIRVDSDTTENMNTEDIGLEEGKTKLVPLTETEQIVYKKLFPLGEETTEICNDTTFYTVFGQVERSLESNLKDQVIDAKSSKARTGGWIWSVISLVMSLISYFMIEDLSPNYSFLYSWAFAGVAVSIFFAIFMGRKTTYGEEITAKVLGFRDYLERAEKQQIDDLVEKNPNYFYDILPYAYVLDVSKAWIEKFEKIPDADMGNFDYCDMNSLDSLSNSVYYPTSSGSSSGGSSSCGGGCSSCGGGCSSCGGGGSW